MIDVKELLYDIDLKLNKVGANEHQNIPLEDKVIALNDAQISIVKSKFSENNIFRMGIDSNQKRVNDLEMLIEKNKFLPLKNDNNPLNSWSANLDLLKPEYMLGIPGSEYILASKGDCKNNALVVNQIKNSDVQVMMNNTNTRSSFEYQEVLGTISGHRYEIYTDGSFIPGKFYLSYVRYPQKVDYEGYTHFNGAASQIVNSELPYYLKEEIVEVAVRNLALATENVNAVQASQIKIQTVE